MEVKKIDQFFESLVIDYNPEEQLKTLGKGNPLKKNIKYNNIFGAIINPNDTSIKIDFSNENKKDWIKYYLALLIQRYEIFGPFFYYPKTYIHYFDNGNTERTIKLDLRNYDRLIIFNGKRDELLIINLYNDNLLFPGNIVSDVHFYGKEEKEGKERAKKISKVIIENNFNKSHSVIFKGGMFYHKNYPKNLKNDNMYELIHYLESITKNRLYRDYGKFEGIKKNFIITSLLMNQIITNTPLDEKQIKNPIPIGYLTIKKLGEIYKSIKQIRERKIDTTISKSKSSLNENNLFERFNLISDESDYSEHEKFNLNFTDESDYSDHENYNDNINQSEINAFMLSVSEETTEEEKPEIENFYETSSNESGENDIKFDLKSSSNKLQCMSSIIKEEKQEDYIHDESSSESSI